MLSIQIVSRELIVASWESVDNGLSATLHSMSTDLRSWLPSGYAVKQKRPALRCPNTTTAQAISESLGISPNRHLDREIALDSPRPMHALEAACDVVHHNRCMAFSRRALDGSG
jgi:hypothetical protein